MKIIFPVCFLLALALSFSSTAQNTGLPPAKGEEKFIDRPKLTRGPYLQVATDTSMVIRWRTDALCRSKVMVGTEEGKLNQIADDIQLTTEHVIRIGGLTPGTKYYYAFGTLKDTLGIGSDFSFSTFPRSGQTGLYRIGVFGDPGDLTINQAKVRDEFLDYLGSNQLNAWILLGDNAYNDGNDMEYQAKFFTPFKQMLKKYPMFPSPGNHEYHDADFNADFAARQHIIPYYKIFSMPIDGEAGGVPSKHPSYYSFNIGNIHFISLDSYGMEENRFMIYDEDGPQCQWLKKDLASNRNKGWVIVFFHHPPYSKGTHDGDTDEIMTGIRQMLLKLFEENGVDLVICGHSHVYERSKLMQGYYGIASEFNASKFQLSKSSGEYESSKNDSPYIKDGKNERGVVYVVQGSSSYVGKAEYAFPHPAMYYSNDTSAGAGMLEINENRLDFKWICADGKIRDQFTMMKHVNKHETIKIKRGESATLTASYVGKYKWNTGQDSKYITVTPEKTVTYSVHDPMNYLHDTFEVVVTPPSR